MSQIIFIDKKKNISDAISGTCATTFTSNKHYYLKLMHLNGLWLKCGCVNHGAISFVRQRGNTYSLVNKGAEGQHSQNCLLWSLVNQGQGEPLAPSKGRKINKFNPVRIGDSASTGGNGNSTGRGNTKQIQHTIHALLCNLLAGKSINRVMTLNKYYAGKSYNLKDVSFSRAASAVVCNELKVKDLLFIPPKTEHSISKKEVEKIADKFDKNTALQFYTILLVDDLDYDKEKNTTEISIGNKSRKLTFNKTTHSYVRTTGPRVCFIVQAIIDGKWTNQIIYTHPIVQCKYPILVDSDLERQFFHKLVENLPQKAVITKPYFSDDYKGRVLKPDFIVSDGEKDIKKRKSVVVEVMGLIDDPDYQARKKELIPMMKSRYKSEVIEVLPKSQDDSIRSIIQSIS
ncbi:hypothetical protein NQT72_01715 [Pseudoalteromonas carrageenovora]|uniref:hypothetical protein n=1 Tax=Pseudoalteromonas TaxID=53246 RepID=UPI001600220A|nr:MULTISPECIES: hypothetical protein [Pseudoalteromonas]MBB1450056.1 hypothetical protein [Pseudoalteromonas sp. SG43-1]MCQ8888241.1 hypothetical protein [Pseudoalteromonas carrageenovora]